jgi:hypothetical protein
VIFIIPGDFCSGVFFFYPLLLSALLQPLWIIPVLSAVFTRCVASVSGEETTAESKTKVRV